jgi:hypothetical protein
MQTQENKEMAVGSVTVVSTPREKGYDPSLDPGLVAVVIGYPESYAGRKFFTDGETKYVSKEVAKQFVSSGIGKLVATEEAPTAPSAPAGDASVETGEAKDIETGQPGDAGSAEETSPAQVEENVIHNVESEGPQSPEHIDESFSTKVPAPPAQPTSSNKNRNKSK